MATIKNPILPGFNPDPAICRQGEDIYIATSTFEWWPGVQIHHSKDMVNWRLVSRPLDRLSQLDLRGVEDSGGVWAPCLTHAHGLFWLVYSNVQCKTRPYYDSKNYVVSAPSVEGPWSEPAFLNRTGFDPSLFHDDDGRSWLTTMRWYHLPNRTKFDGIVLQEYDREQKKLVGPIIDIFEKSIGGTEGPHLIKKDGWYYLILAEGGTGWHHAITVARSKSIEGPYEVHPQNPMLTSWGDPENPIQKSGHGGFVQCPDGSWWTSHLCGRPMPDTTLTNGKGDEIPGSGRCLLGRETSIQPIQWDEDGWPRLVHGGNHPRQEIPGPDLPAHPWPPEPTSFDFSDGRVPFVLQSNRKAISEDWVKVENGKLRIQGGTGPINRFDPNTLARRITTFTSSATTRVLAEPRHHQHEAGLMAFYDNAVWFALVVSFDRFAHDGAGARVLRMAWMDCGEFDVDEQSVVLLEEGPVDLRWCIEGRELRAYHRQGDGAWQKLGKTQDASKLSDDYDKTTGNNFTGAWYAIQATDACGDGFHADFDFLDFEDGQLPEGS